MADQTPSLSKPTKFNVYKNPALSQALLVNSLRPTKYTFLCLFTMSVASAFSLLNIVSKEDGFIENLTVRHVTENSAYYITKIVQSIVGLVFMGTISALIRVISFQRSKNVSSVSPSKGTNEQKSLTERQIMLLGINGKAPMQVVRVDSDSGKKPPLPKPYLTTSPSEPLIPIDQQVFSPSRSYKIGGEKPNISSGSRMNSFYTPSKSPSSPSSMFFAGSSVQSSPGVNRILSSPWSKQRSPGGREITTEDMLEEFLADVDDKITESASKMATPPPTINSFGIASPSTIVTSANTPPGTTRSTPLRPVRMSPGSQKFSTPPKKGEGDFPSPLSMEESIEAFMNLGIYPQIEQWRDRLRQWISLVLLNPLLDKIETTHIQVMQAAARLGISVTISQVGSDSPSTTSSAATSPLDGTKEWQQSFIMDEEGVLHQLRATLVQALNTSVSKLPLSNLQQPLSQDSPIPLIQECVNAITEHQRLHSLMKGEWVKGLLPQSSVRADYTVQRIQELAEGTCLKNYEYLGNGEVYDMVKKKWTLELPTDSHLLLYLFCAFLEHPKWMLHVDPTSYTSAQSSKNPLFVGILPSKERFPEKYVAVISGVPGVLHPGACILAVGKQSPPVFALYWNKKLQFSLQGRTALWDAILLLCHKINLSYGSVVRGMHLGSSFDILSVIDPQCNDC